MSSFTHSRNPGRKHRRSASVVALNRDIERLEDEDTVASPPETQAQRYVELSESAHVPREPVAEPVVPGSQAGMPTDELNAVIAELSTLSTDLEQLFKQHTALQKSQAKADDKIERRQEKFLNRQRDESKFARKMLGRFTKYLDALKREQSERASEYKELREAYDSALREHTRDLKKLRDAHDSSMREHARDLKKLNESFEDQKRKMSEQTSRALSRSAKAMDAKHRAQKERNAALRMAERVTDKVAALEREMAKEMVPLRELVDTYREREKILMAQLDEARKDLKSLQILKNA